MPRLPGRGMRIGALLATVAVIGALLSGCAQPKTPTAEATSPAAASAPAAPPHERRETDRRAGARRVGRHVQLGRRGRGTAEAGLRRPRDRQPAGEPHHRLRVRRELPQIAERARSCWSAIPTADRSSPTPPRAIRTSRRWCTSTPPPPTSARPTARSAGRTRCSSRSRKANCSTNFRIPGAPAGAVDLYLKKDVFLQYFGNDLPADVATRLWATQRTASTSAFETPSKFAAWKTIPSWYFISSGDQIITPTSEKAMAARAHSHVTVFDGGSHLTLISHPDAVTAVIDQAIDSVH